MNCLLRKIFGDGILDIIQIFCQLKYGVADGAILGMYAGFALRSLVFADKACIIMFQSNAFTLDNHTFQLKIDLLDLIDHSKGLYSQLVQVSVLQNE